MMSSIKAMVPLERARYMKYLVFYEPGEDGHGIKGIRDDAPEDVIDEYYEYYRQNNRYENGRLRPASKSARNKLLVHVR